MRILPSSPSLLALALLMSRVRAADDVEVPSVSLAAFPPHDLFWTKTQISKQALSYAQWYRLFGNQLRHCTALHVKHWHVFVLLCHIVFPGRGAETDRAGDVN